MKDEKKAEGRRRKAAGCILLSAFRFHHSLFFISENIHFICKQIKGIG